MINFRLNCILVVMCQAWAWDCSPAPPNQIWLRLDITNKKPWKFRFLWIRKYLPDHPSKANFALLEPAQKPKLSKWKVQTRTKPKTLGLAHHHCIIWLASKLYIHTLPPPLIYFPSSMWNSYYCSIKGSMILGNCIGSSVNTIFGHDLPRYIRFLVSVFR